MQKQIWKITTEGDAEGRTTRVLGYAVGNEQDIKKYYDSEKYYKLYLDPIEIIEITPDSVNERIQLTQERTRLLKRLESIDKSLKLK